MQPEYIFETSWEVCNRVGGIYAVLSTRAASMQAEHKDKPYIYLNNYVEISRRYYVVKDDNGHNRAIPVKIKEGNREKILFRNALLRLKIDSKMSFENLLYAMVYERTYWIDKIGRAHV